MGGPFPVHAFLCCAFLGTSASLLPGPKFTIVNQTNPRFPRVIVFSAPLYPYPLCCIVSQPCRKRAEGGDALSFLSCAITENAYLLPLQFIVRVDSCQQKSECQGYKIHSFGCLPLGATTSWVLGDVECTDYYDNLLLPEERFLTNIQLVPEFFRGAPKGGSVFDTPTIPLILNN